MNRNSHERFNEPMYQKYIVGEIYEGKGKYIGESKGAHKFEKHAKPFFQGRQFGPKYFFEKV